MESEENLQKIISNLRNHVHKNEKYNDIVRKKSQGVKDGEKDLNYIKKTCRDITKKTLSKDTKQMEITEKIIDACPCSLVFSKEYSEKLCLMELRKLYSDAGLSHEDIELILAQVTKPCIHLFNYKYN